MIDFSGRSSRCSCSSSHSRSPRRTSRSTTSTSAGAARSSSKARPAPPFCSKPATPARGRSTSFRICKSIGVQPANGLDYIIGGHQHCDHIGGLDEVINAGYNVHIKQYYNGSIVLVVVRRRMERRRGRHDRRRADRDAGRHRHRTSATARRSPASRATARSSAAARSPVTDENDRSIALLIKYGGFDYIWASDMGGGPDSLHRPLARRSSTSRPR